VLGLLVLQVGQVVAADRLVEAAWNGRAPATARSQLHSLVSALRRALVPAAQPGKVPVETVGVGYTLRAGPEDCDLSEFQARLGAGRQAAAEARPELAARLLAQALMLWRGPAFDALDCRALGTEAQRLEQLRLAAVQECARLELDLGRAGDATTRLAPFAATHPLHEGLRELLMLALYRSGRAPEALATYRQLREILADEVGMEPGPTLQDLHRQIGAAQATPHPVPPQPVSRHPVRPPAQLPPDLMDFTGRAEITDRLCQLLTGAGAVPVCAITGPSGIGKTSLAVHAAHHVRHRFPDGQLYVDLRGVGGQPHEPGAVLSRFLRDLGVEPERLLDPDERAARYRSLLAGRRVLLVLDNARDAAQIAPLLPGAAGCAVLVTSRGRRADWYVYSTVTLPGLDADESRVLLARIAGADRVSAEPDATGAVVAACAGIPLALRVAGARLAGRPGWQVRDLADRLTDRQRRLRELAAADLELRAGFRDSYRGLPAAANPAGISPARAFRLLGAAATATIALVPAAALFGCGTREAEAALSVLVDECLVDEPSPGSYQLHDFVQPYADECADEVAPEERDVAVRRLQWWYQYQAPA
jgi:DNA-binding SARP family transcriptional activator